MSPAKAAAPALAKPSVGTNDWWVPLATVVMIFMMIVPVPAFGLDLLLAVSITFGIVVLLSALYILKPVQFSLFPTLLLFLTLFRISLNIASSRRILLHGNEGTAAAGNVIEAFGQFVVGGNYVVGFVIFLALIAIQYLVINHGAVRTAEVTARFTLDALPGKQMAIDADLNAGLIDESQARARRQQIAREAEFYGAMDGAARFSQRDALATILITVINILAGFLIGVFQLNIPFDQALKTYTVLTVGDGLVTLIPSLLVSVAGGIVVTRTSSDSMVGVEFGRQLLNKKGPLRIAAGVMLALGLIPGMPKLSFFVLAAGTAYLASRAKGTSTETPAAETAAKPDKTAGSQQQIEQLLRLDDLSLEVGYALVSLVDQAQGGHLLQRIRALRRHLALQLGFLVPSIHITDNMKLKPREYVVYLRGVEIARWEMYQDRVLAISSEQTAAPLDGIDAPAVAEAQADLAFGHAPRSPIARLAVAETGHEIASAGRDGGFEALLVRAAVCVVEYVEEAAVEDGVERPIERCQLQGVMHQETRRNCPFASLHLGQRDGGGGAVDTGGVQPDARGH